MGTDLRRFDTVLDPIRAHPRNPWLKQALRSISTYHPSKVSAREHDKIALARSSEIQGQRK